MEARSYKKNRFVIALVAIAGMSVYLLPYFRYYYVYPFTDWIRYCREYHADVQWLVSGTLWRTGRIRSDFQDIYRYVMYRSCGNRYFP